VAETPAQHPGAILRLARAAGVPAWLTVPCWVLVDR